MNPEDFKKLVNGYITTDITYDEPHVTMRCRENNITLDDVKRIVLDIDAELVRVVRDRSDVYKLYYRLSRHRELKVVIDLLTHKYVNIRAVKILNDRFQLGSIKRQRF